MEKDKITLPSGETFSKWRFIDIDRIEYSEEHKDKFEKKLCDKIPINKKKQNWWPPDLSRGTFVIFSFSVPLGFFFILFPPLCFEVFAHLHTAP